MALARAGDIEISYERAGDGPPLLMIMGLSGTYEHWGEPLLALMRRDFDVIVYDHRGVGRSSPVQAPFSIADLAADAASLLQALGVREAHVLGFSMGGMVAQELALAHPQMVRTLVLASTYCGGAGSEPARQETLQRLGEAATSGDRQRAIDVSWEVNTSPAYAGDAEAYARFLAIAQRRRVTLEVVQAQVFAIAAHDTSERLSQLRMPTLVIHGSADAMVPVANAHMIAGLVPGAHLELLDGAGHLFFWEYPDRAAGFFGGHALAAGLQRARASSPGG